MANSGISTFPSPEEGIHFCFSQTETSHYIKDTSELERTVFHLALLWNWQESFTSLQAKMQSVIFSNFSIRRKGGENFIEFCLRRIGKALLHTLIYEMKFLYVTFSNGETSHISYPWDETY